MPVRVEHVMGMPVVVELRDTRDDADELFDAVFGLLRAVDATFSTYKEESEISRIRRGELALEDASDEVRLVLARCEELRDETNGYFDATAWGLDPSGYVKGWAVDRAAALLDRAGCRDYAVNAGGDMCVRGKTWRVGIQHPTERNAVAKVIEADDLAVATSGGYERGEHVRDPHTGLAASGIASVTVTGPDLGTADAYATATLAMGVERAKHFTARLRGYEALTITSDGRVLATPGFPA
ncbi:MAG TPA: FAD:protein FMN transferase [Gaiellaceae bacterium]|nr:FAD:protein FMN transferase [Gaiellaceae bacterium]